MKYSLASVSVGLAQRLSQQESFSGEEHDVLGLSIQKHLSEELPFPALIARLDIWEISKDCEGIFFSPEQDTLALPRLQNHKVYERQVDASSVSLCTEREFRKTHRTARHLFRAALPQKPSGFPPASVQWSFSG